MYRGNEKDASRRTGRAPVSRTVIKGDRKSVSKNNYSILFSFRMVLSLLITSCSDKETGPENITKIQYSNPAAPKYGGIHNRIRTTNWNGWDYAAPPYMSSISLMGEELLDGDWTRGRIPPTESETVRRL